MPPCLCVGGLWGGGSGHWVRAQWRTFVLLQRAVVLLLACGGATGPTARLGCPTTRPPVVSVGRMTCSFLQPND